MSADFARALTDGTEGYAAAAEVPCDPPCHAHGLGCACRPAKPRWVDLFGIDPDYVTDAVEDSCCAATRNTAAETILAEAEVACAGLHVASPERGRIMALARRFAEAVRAS